VKTKCSCGHEIIYEKEDIFSHRLMCGDSTDKATVEKLMDGKKADMVFMKSYRKKQYNFRCFWWQWLNFDCLSAD
jgi:hypothetical protein